MGGLDISVILPPELGYNHPVMPKSQATATSPTPPSGVTPVWSIKLFYSEAIKLLKRRRDIWILVILVVIFTSGSSNSFQSFGDSSSSDESSESEEVEQYDSSTPQINRDRQKVKGIQSEEVSEFEESDPKYGAAIIKSEVSPIAADLNDLIEEPSYFFDLLKQVGWGWYAFLGLNMFALVIWSILFSLIAAAWVKASLVWAVYRESQLKPWQLGDAVKAGAKLIGSFIWLQLVPAFGAIIVFTLGTLGVGLVIALLAFIAKTSPWAVIAMAALGTAYLAIVLYGAFKLTVMYEIAERLVVAQALPAYDAFRLAFQWAKGMSCKFFRLAASEAAWQVGVVIVAIIPLFITGFLMGSMGDQMDSSLMGLSFIMVAILFILAVVIFFLVVFGLGLVAQGMHVALWQMAWNYLASVKNSAVKVQKA